MKLAGLSDLLVIIITGSMHTEGIYCVSNNTAVYGKLIGIV